MGKGRTNAGGGYDVSGVTATAADVSKAKYFINSSGELLQGTIDLASATAVAANVAKGKYFINKNGALVQGTIDFAQADATVGNVRNGKKFINSAGEVKTGTLADYSGSYNVTPSTSSQTLQTQGKYMTSNVIIAGTSGGISEITSSKNGDGTTTIEFTVSGITPSSTILAWGISATPSAEAVVMAAGSGVGNGSAVFAHNVGSILQVETGTVKCNGASTMFSTTTVSFTSNNSSRVFSSAVSYSLWIKYQ